MAKKFKCKCCSSYTWPAYIWASLSILAAFMCPFGLYFSNWLVARQADGTYNSASSFRVCLNETSRISFSCDSYLMFDRMYSTYWQAVTLLMGIGTCFMVLVALTSIFGFFVRKLFNPVVVAITGSFQALGVILFIVGLLVFPAGMDVPQVRQLCGENSGRFSLGNCDIGWAYSVICVGTALGLIATAMSWTPVRWRDRDREESYSI